MPLSLEEKDAITESMVVKNYKKGTVLLEEGKIATECYFVMKGCVRQYYMVDGEEVTNNFFTEEQFVFYRFHVLGFSGSFVWFHNEFVFLVSNIYETKVSVAIPRFIDFG